MINKQNNYWEGRVAMRGHKNKVRTIYNAHLWGYG